MPGTSGTVHRKSIRYGEKLWNNYQINYIAVEYGEFKIKLVDKTFWNKEENIYYVCLFTVWYKGVWIMDKGKRKILARTRPWRSP